jgi:ABC-type dipeptide/oligopeptide/nickel transport system ATPase component
LITDKVLEIYDLRIEFNTFEGTAKIINGIDLAIGKMKWLD